MFLSESQSDAAKIFLIRLLYLLAVLSISVCIYLSIISGQPWKESIIVVLLSCFCGLAVTFLVLGGQLSNRYCSADRLDAVCACAMFLLYLLFLLLLVDLGIKSWSKTVAVANTRRLITFCIVSGMFSGAHYVKRVNEKRLMSGASGKLK